MSKERIELFKEFMRGRMTNIMNSHSSELLNIIPQNKSRHDEGFKYLNAMHYRRVLDDMESSLEEYYYLFLQEKG